MCFDLDFGILGVSMKANTHPQYFQAQVTCACGNTMVIGSTQPKISVELCNKCHPFYTGSQKFVDTASLIQKFNDRKKKADAIKVTVTKKKEEEIARKSSPKTLAEMLAALK